MMTMVFPPLLLFSVLIMLISSSVAAPSLVFDHVAVMGNSGTHQREDPCDTIAFYDKISEKTYVLSDGNGTILGSTDGGITFTRQFSGGLSLSVPTKSSRSDVMTRMSVRNGIADYLDKPVTSAAAVSSTVWSVDITTETFSMETSTDPRNITWNGMPHPTWELSIDSGGVAVLPDGSMVATPVVWFANTSDTTFNGTESNAIPGPCCNNSIVSFISKDGGYTWDFAAIIAEKATSPYKSQEGPNENNIVLLKDEKTLWLVYRVDGGDGVPDQKHVPYASRISTDGGYTWSSPTTLPSHVLSCKPKAAVLRETGSLVLSGGRPGLSVWASFDGVGQEWTQYDIPSIHNTLVTSENKFCDAFLNANLTLGWSQSSGYTTITALGAREGLVCYQRQGFGSGGYHHPIPQECAVDYSTNFCMHFIEK